MIKPFKFLLEWPFLSMGEEKEYWTTI